MAQVSSSSSLLFLLLLLLSLLLLSFYLSMKCTLLHSFTCLFDQQTFHSLSSTCCCWCSPKRRVFVRSNFQLKITYTRRKKGSRRNSSFSTLSNLGTKYKSSTSFCFLFFHMGNVSKENFIRDTGKSCLCLYVTRLVYIRIILCQSCYLCTLCIINCESCQERLSKLCVAKKLNMVYILFFFLLLSSLHTYFAI